MSNAGIFDSQDTWIARMRDWKAPQRWYHETLGLASRYHDQAQKPVVLDLGGPVSLTLWELKAGEQLPPAGSAVGFPIFRVAHIDLAHRLLEGRGAAPSPIREGGGVRYSPA
ncbi:MAG: hypothetical protein AB1445_13900 [Bacillota bacterium]